MASPAAIRVLKVAGIGVGILIVLVVLCLIAISLFIDPNAYKGRIEQMVQTSTGRTLTLSGKLKLAVFPAIALQLGPASLGNPPGFGTEPFASLQRASLQVRLLPLLHKQLQVGHVEIDGLDLRLKTNAHGQGNWELSGGAPSSQPAATTSVTTSSSTQLPEVAGIVIKNSRFSYQDEVADHVDFDVGHIASGATVPVQFKLDLLRSPGAQPIALAGKMELTLGQDAYGVSALNVRLDSSTLRGNAAVSRASDGAISFDLSLDQIDLDRYLGTAAGPANKPQTAPSAGQTPAELPTDSIKTLQLRGKLAIGSARLEGLTLSQVQVGLQANNGVLHIAPVSATLYGGSSSGDVTLDAHGVTPVVKLAQNVSGVQVGPLLKDFMHTQRLTGRGNLTLNLTGQGKTTDALIHTLDGRVAANLVNGAVTGIDLWYEIRQALALFQRQAAAAGSNQGQTKFDTFRASADIAQGIATTKDLTIASQDLRVTGDGTANLATEAVNYRLQVALLKGAPTASATPGALLTVPVDVTGTLSNPKVRPDVSALARSSLQNLNKAQLQQKIPGLLKGLLKNRSSPQH